MKHNASWLTLMVIAVCLFLTATRHFEALFIASIIGLAGASLAFRQQVDRRVVFADALVSGIAAILAVVMVLAQHR